MRKTENPKHEVRTFTVRELSTRAAEGNGPRKLVGYASVFNVPTVIGDNWFTEEIVPGAFKTSIQEKDVRALFNHDWNNVLGRMSSGTLKLSEDDKGLLFEIELPDTTLAKDLAIQIDRGDIDQCSFGFIPVTETWDQSVTPAHRRITDLELFEISIVSLPAYEETTVSLRSKSHVDMIERKRNVLQKIKTVLGE